MRYRRAISITIFVISLFGSLVWLMRQKTDNPYLILGWPMLFISWAIAIRWWLVAGALVALVASVITGPLHGQGLDRMTAWMIAGAGVGFLWEFLRRPESKLAKGPEQPTTSSAPDPASAKRTAIEPKPADAYSGLIRTSCEPVRAAMRIPFRRSPMGMIKEFKEFAMKGNVLDMAVGIIIGAAFGKIVSSLVSDVIMPPIGVVMGNVDFSSLAFTLREKTAEAPAVSVRYGVFINTVIDFLIVAFAIFVVIKQLNRLKRPEAPPPVTTKDCPRCLMAIPLKATRCGHCAVDLP